MEEGEISTRSSLGSIMKRRLSTIANSPPQDKDPVILENLDAAASLEYIDPLIKEKLALVKLIQEKNKIIELTGNEILKMRAYLQKMHLQNWSLHQVNSRMLAQLNGGKERVKALQVDLACKESLIKRKNFELKVYTRKRPLVIDEEPELVAEEPGHDNGSKSLNASRRGHQSRRQSLGDAMISKVHAEKESPRTRRRSLRRQSFSSIIENDDLSERLLETENLKKIEVGDVKHSSKSEDRESRRKSCIDRPVRRAAGMVQSYKEKPLNVKLRRPG